MTPATLAEIAALGEPEKQAAQEYTETQGHPYSSVHGGPLTWSQLAFLQGIHWERQRANQARFGELAAMIASVASAREMAMRSYMIHGEAYLAMGPKAFRVLDPTKITISL